MRRLQLLMTLILAALPGLASAQAAALTAHARVFEPLQFQGQGELRFAEVLPGVAQTVAVTSPQRGRFGLLGQANAPVSLRFTLPTDLSAGVARLPIGGWTGCRSAEADPEGCTPFDPGGDASETALTAGGRRVIHLGATVFPTQGQPAGAYGGMITLTVAYL
jgi:hypothetical protein